MKNKLKNMSLQGKISGIYICANLLILIVVLVLFRSINTISGRIDLVYQENLQLSDLSQSLQQVQDSMMEYLSVKTNDSLEDFYRNEQHFSELLMNIEENRRKTSFGYMELSIHNMSQSYLEIVEQTIEAKRGRNVEKYRVRYENATQLYDYIQTYIESLNSERFKVNTSNYSLVLHYFRRFETIGMWLMLFVLAGNVVIIVRLTGTIISPLGKLASAANEVSQNHFDIELPEAINKDEIGVLTGAFQTMVVSIKDYIEKSRKSMEVERELREKELQMEAHLKDAQLKYLQAQINPHFLFNTLNAAAQLSMLEDADRTYEYLQNVAEFFRYNVKNSDEIVTLEQEVKLIDNYIYILNVRFSGEIHYEKDVDEQYLKLHMPGMILQPIVENCVRHGISEMEGKGKISLRVYNEKGQPCISVKDNGIGMSPDCIQKVLAGEWRREEKKPGSNGVGMDNVINRLRLYLGREDVLEIKSEGAYRGTEFIIRLSEKTNQ